MTLTDLGWNDFFAQHFGSVDSGDWVPARVAREHTHLYLVCGEFGELTAEVSGKLRHHATGKQDFPAVGDWVMVQPRPEEGRATIHGVLPRKSAFVRKGATGADRQRGGKTEEQVLAANVDTAFLVSGLDGDFNPRRIERYLTLVWDSGASPIIVLNKTDLCDDVDSRIETVEGIAFGVPVLRMSAVQNDGVEALREHIGFGKTAAFLGSSGVGKSTLINCLLGAARQEVRAVREDDSRGRHTTTYRELIHLTGGGLVIDTPGMRELQLWTDEDGLERTFEDIEELAEQCRFRDCRHGDEPGCAVRDAIEDGRLDAGRWGSYRKLKREVEYASARKEGTVRLLEKARWKKIAEDIKHLKKNK